MNKKIITFFAVFCMAAAILSGCTLENDKISIASSEMTSSEVSVHEIINPLTGETGYDDALLKSRPVAVMINNIKQALPQRGLSSADIIYELPVEGPITRLMAVYSDYKKIPEIGSVRSARHDYVELVLPINAFYVHFGHSSMAQEALNKYKADHVDGVNMAKTAFYFDEQRAKTKSREHCWFTDAKHVQAAIAKKEVSMTTEPLAPLFNFVSDGEKEADSTDATETSNTSLSAQNVIAPLSGSVTAKFTYNTNKKTYSKGEYDAPQLDVNIGNAAEVKNVFLMYTNVSLLSDGKHKDIDLSNGNGYYISEGKVQEVTFKKADAHSMIKVYGTDGAEIKVNPGKSWFCVAPENYRSKINFASLEAN